MACTTPSLVDARARALFLHPTLNPQAQETQLERGLKSLHSEALKGSPTALQRAPPQKPLIEPWALTRAPGLGPSLGWLAFAEAPATQVPTLWKR